ncbi:MAG: glycosyltransferase family 39 protein [Fuerstiella sp.]
MNAPPSATGDEPSYDSIAWELSHGDGYAVDYTDPEFRAPYDKAAGSQPDLFTLPDTLSGPVAFRPPLLPTINAGLNALFGRQFFALRLLNILLMSATAGLLTWFLWREGYAAVALLAAILFLLDVRTRLYARALLTEAMACLLATLLTLVMVRLSRRMNRRDIALAGVLAGLSILTRSIVVLWLPGLLITVLWLGRRIHHQRWIQCLGRAGIFLTTALLVILPWSIRNIRLLDTFAPMGTQGWMEISAGYSEIAVQHGGVWQNLGAAGFFDDVDTTGLTGVQRELVLADYSRAAAFSWIRRHTSKIPLLAVMKVYHEFRPHSWYEALVLVLGALGAVTTIRQRSTQIFLALLLTNAAAIGLTWSVEGRFLVPQLFILYALSGKGLWVFCRRLPKRDLSRRTMGRSVQLTTKQTD